MVPQYLKPTNLLQCFPRSVTDFVLFSVPGGLRVTVSKYYFKTRLLSLVTEPIHYIK